MCFSVFHVQYVSFESWSVLLIQMSYFHESSSRKPGVVVGGVILGPLGPLGTIVGGFGAAATRAVCKRERSARTSVWQTSIRRRYPFRCRLLCYLVRKEAETGMIDHAEMHHCEDEDCACCA
jgi:hypothetical protein